MGKFEEILSLGFNNQPVIIFALMLVIVFLGTLWLALKLNEEADDKTNEDRLIEIETALRRVLEENPGTGSPAQMANLIKDSDKPAAPGLAAPGAKPPGAIPGYPGATGPVGATAGTPSPLVSLQPLTSTVAPAAAPAVNTAELEKFKKDAEEKAAKLAELEKALNATKDELKKAKEQPATNPGEFDALQNKLKELEARLKEYEIIEDDIANLSLYKEENTRLKNELSRLKGATPGGAAVAAPSAAPAAEEIVMPAATAEVVGMPTEPATPAEDLLSAVAAMTGGVAPVEAPPKAAPAPAPVVQAAPLQENNAATNPTLDMSLSSPLSAEPSGSSVTGQPLEGGKMVADVVEGGESSLLDELTGALSGAPEMPAVTMPTPVAPSAPTPVASPTPAAVVAAPAAVVAAPVAAPVEEAAPPPVVDKGIDPDKLLQEFDTLMAAPPAQAVEAGKDSGQKLIDEFENFMKGSGGT